MTPDDMPPDYQNQIDSIFAEIWQHEDPPSRLDQMLIAAIWVFITVASLSVTYVFILLMVLLSRAAF